MRCLLLLVAIAAGVPSLSIAAEVQWIWRHKDAASQAEQETVYFRKAFDVESPEGGSLEITADSRFEVFLNGRRVGSGDNWQRRYRFEIGRLLLPGRNLLAVAATNGGPDPAGLAVRAVVKNKGKEPIEVASDGSWKQSTSVAGTWTRIESDDSQWQTAAALGDYGKTAPWGAAGPLVEGESDTIVPNKPRSREKGLFQFRDGDRVLLLGSAFIERLQFTGYFETMITAAFPHKKITFRNLGWSGDTVWGDARAGFGNRADGFARLVSDVALCDPTVLIICYGENEAYAGEAGLADFRTGLNTLLDSLEATGARIVLLGPRQHENLGPPLPNPTPYNADLRKYNDVIGQVAQEREHTFVGLDDGLRGLPVPTGLHLTDNGMHLAPHGDWFLSELIANRLGVYPHGWRVELDTLRGNYDAVGAAVLQAAVKPDRVSITVAPATIIPPSSPSYEFARVVMRTDVVARFRFQNLSEGDFALRCGEAIVGTHNAKTWAEGVSLVAESDQLRLTELQRAINEKNDLFFHRYRPQNETYLFLFRKHEQGNNAVEIPRFDPLIEDLEQKIDALKQPAHQTFGLTKVK